MNCHIRCLHAYTHQSSRCHICSSCPSNQDFLSYLSVYSLTHTFPQSINNQLHHHYGVQPTWDGQVVQGGVPQSTWQVRHPALHGQLTQAQLTRSGHRGHAELDPASEHTFLMQIYKALLLTRISAENLLAHGTHSVSARARAARPVSCHTYLIKLLLLLLLPPKIS